MAACSLIRKRPWPMGCDCSTKVRTCSTLARRARGPAPWSAPSSSTPPAVSAEAEQARLLPVLEGILKARPDAVISVDTYKSATARAALAAGAKIINDVSGFTWDAEMAGVCAQARCGVVLMHTRGRPDQWSAQEKLAPDALLKLVHTGLAASLDLARAAGIAPDSIVLDPGYGFGKKFDENYSLLARQAELLSLGRPLLAGVSRKSFLGHTLAHLYGGAPAPADARETASIAAMVAAILEGASIVRVHRVQPAVEAARIADAVISSPIKGRLNASTSRAVSRQCSSCEPFPSFRPEPARELCL